MESGVVPLLESLMPPRFLRTQTRAWSIHNCLPPLAFQSLRMERYPFVRYVIRNQGELELSGNSCARCHTRVIPDVSIVKGAQGNFPLDRVKEESVSRTRRLAFSMVGALVQR